MAESNSVPTELADILSASPNSIPSLTIESSLLPSLTLPTLYSKLQNGGRLTLLAPMPSQKKSLIFAGFCKIEETSSSISCFKPANTNASELQIQWKKALEPGQDLVNEESLLEEDEEYKTLASEQDCLTRAKPCKNCTCGRADELNKLNQVAELSSSCGRCHLGDAFRCAGCPFRGTPAFVPGQKVESDLGVVVAENSAKISGGKVKLEI